MLTPDYRNREPVGKHRCHYKGENSIPMLFDLLLRSAFLICVLCCSYLFSQASEASAQRIPFCTLLREPDRYRDSLITLRVTVKTFRHGTLIFDPSCSKQGLGLIADQSTLQTTSVSHFYQFLQEHRLSKNPDSRNGYRPFG